MIVQQTLDVSSSCFSRFFPGQRIQSTCWPASCSSCIRISWSTRLFLWFYRQFPPSNLLLTPSSSGDEGKAFNLFVSRESQEPELGSCCPHELLMWQTGGKRKTGDQMQRDSVHLTSEIRKGRMMSGGGRRGEKKWQRDPKDANRLIDWNRRDLIN